MTHGAASRRIHIQVTDADANDLGALHRWLSLEEWFTQAEENRQLKVAYREDNGTERTPAAGPAGPPMSGPIVELVLVITGTALSPLFEDLYARAKVAVRAWSENTSSEDRTVDAVVRRDPETAPDTEDDEGGRDT